MDGGGGDLLIVFVVILVGVGSFGLGRLSVATGEGTPISMHMAATTVAPPPLPVGGQVVASRNGSKYYYPWCGGAKTISPANLVWFTSEAKAQSAGYTPASNCKGLIPAK
jgi:hypothetical protein